MRRTPAEIIDEVRCVVGEANYREFANRWERATSEDSIAMEQALKDLRARIATKGPVRDRGSWLFGTWVKLRRRQLEFESGARR
jgi:hypothetical protein